MILLELEARSISRVVSVILRVSELAPYTVINLNAFAIRSRRVFEVGRHHRVADLVTTERFALHRVETRRNMCPPLYVNQYNQKSCRDSGGREYEHRRSLRHHIHVTDARRDAGSTSMIG